MPFQNIIPILTIFFVTGELYLKKSPGKDKDKLWSEVEWSESKSSCAHEHKHNSWFYIHVCTYVLVTLSKKSWIIHHTIINYSEQTLFKTCIISKYIINVYIYFSKQKSLVWYSVIHFRFFPWILKCARMSVRQKRKFVRVCMCVCTFFSCCWSGYRMFMKIYGSHLQFVVN